MIDYDAAIAYYHSLRPTDFHDLQRLEVRQLFQTASKCDLTVEVELRPKEKTDNRRLLLSFHGVRSLRFIPTERSMLYFNFIEIVSIRSYQWEDVNYKVEESEQDSEFSFLCRTFDASIRIE